MKNCTLRVAQPRHAPWEGARVGSVAVGGVGLPHLAGGQGEAGACPGCPQASPPAGAWSRQSWPCFYDKTVARSLLGWKGSKSEEGFFF